MYLFFHKISQKTTTQFRRRYVFLIKFKHQGENDICDQIISLQPQ